jgi:hypothetical protein
LERLFEQFLGKKIFSRFRKLYNYSILSETFPAFDFSTSWARICRYTMEKLVMNNPDNIPQLWTFKEGCDPNEFTYLHPILLHIFFDLVSWAIHKKLPIVVTRMVDGMIPGISISDTHGQGRAIDFSIIGWTTNDMDACQEYINDKYAEDFGAIGITDGIKKCLKFHDGTALHGHVQCGKDVL